ncbi:class I SAM-dependent methyltransferase [Bradyrhizobium sp. OK095]|uniref:class I SAM-dependent methyltransferase n=1 Tax=Bradyrhizobium sp. OK095 TaxID=1882760 RepID=UPI0008C93176|nr:class I SAM-dependent methyltransferase [Bradyrhizobium sp. OK095]SEN76926.1 Methyltransferase domain-containing protein [Bradyrhizobium sp. OK095]
MAETSRRTMPDLATTPRFELKPDTGECRLCGFRDQQRIVGQESYLGSGQSLRRCGACAGVYLAPDFTAQSLDVFYREHYRRLFPSETIWRNERRFFAWRGDKAIADARLARIAPYLSTGAHLFEMGSGFGAFLGAVGALHIQGLRLSATEPDGASRTRLLQGASVDFLADMEALNPESVDVVAAFHVLEHLPDPMAFLRAVYNVLRPAGRAFVEVPDMMQGLRFANYVHPAHLSYFTADTLSRIARAAGFDVLHAGAHPDGGVLAENIWLELAKPREVVVPPAVMSASRGEVATVDAKLDEVNWQASSRQRWRRIAKAFAIRLFGLGPVGELQRFRQWRSLRRAGWA